jgi:hypothetical protein
VIQDFSKVELTDSSLSILVVLVLCIYSVSPEGQPRHEYVDVFSQSSTDKSDCEFIVGAWRHLLEHTSHFRGARGIGVWSDGPTKEFRNRYVQRFFASMETNYKVQCTYDYFIPYHGKNVCDSHAFHVKRQVSNFILEREGMVAQHQFSHHSDRSTTECEMAEDLLKPIRREALAARITSRVENTSVYFFLQ